MQTMCNKCWMRCARRCESYPHLNTTASRTVSATSSPAATQQVTTAISGRKFFPPTPTRDLKRKGFSTRKRAHHFSGKCSLWAVHARLWTPLSLFVGANRISRRCCATQASPPDSPSSANHHRNCNRVRLVNSRSSGSGAQCRPGLTRTWSATIAGQSSLPSHL